MSKSKIESLDHRPDWLGLPSGVYGSDEFHAQEKAKIFGREWLCVGKRADLAFGDYFPADVAGRLIVVVNQAEGVRAYANVCAHRGMPVVSAKGRSRRIACPYHAWTYDLKTGGLTSAPRSEFAPERCAAIGLKKVRCETWQDFIFVAFDDTAPPLAHGLEPLEKVARAFSIAETTTALDIDEVWETDWKCFVENFSESYHVFVVHRDTLEKRTPTSSTDQMQTGPRFAAHRLTELGGARGDAGFNPSVARPHRDKEWIIALFPATLFAVGSNYTLWLSALPLSPKRVRIKGAICASPHLSAYLHSFPDRIADLRNDIRAFFDEDRRTVERQLDGLASGLAQFGMLTKHDQPIAAFAAYYRQVMGLMDPHAKSD